MKKTIFVLLSLLIIAGTVASAGAKTTVSGPLASAIKLYKSGNYVQSYDAFIQIVHKDPSNAVAFYYLAMTCAQMGRRSEAIDNYSRVIELSTNRQLTNYAKKGRTCIESPDRCNEPDASETEEDRFIRAPYGTGLSKEVRSDFEKKKIENLMREINRNKEIEPKEFKEYKDFSSELPTNDEIVSAIRVLQRAGLAGMINTNSYGSDLSMLTGKSNEAQILNILTGGRNSNVSPQVIQSLLTTQFTGGF